MRDAVKRLILLMTDALLAEAREGTLDLSNPAAVEAALRAWHFGTGAILAFGEQARAAARSLHPAPAPAVRPIPRATK